MKNSKVIIDTIVKVVKKHAPKIAVGVGGALLLTGGYLLGKEVPKYKKEIAEKTQNLEEGEELPVKEKATIAAKHFVAPICVIAGGTAALCLSVHENEKRIAIGTSAATALSKLSEIKDKNLNEYKEAVKDVVSEEDQNKIESVLAKKKEDPIVVDDMDIPPYPPEKGKYWCRDLVFGGQWFQTDVPTLEKCEIELASRLLAEGYGSTAALNDVYELVGHELIDAGDHFGFPYDPGKGHKMVDLRIDSMISNGELILTISPDVSLIDEYFKSAGTTY